MLWNAAVQEAGAARMAAFMQALTQHCVDSLYPAAPHARKHLALRLLHNILQTYAADDWIATPVASFAPTVGGDLPRREVRGVWKRGDDAALQKVRAAQSPLGRFQPLCAALRSPEFIEVCLSTGR